MLQGQNNAMHIEKYIASSRRDFLKNTGRIAVASSLAGVSVPESPRGREQHDPIGPDRLRSTRHRRGGQCLDGQARAGQAGCHGRRVSRSDRTTAQVLAAQHRGQLGSDHGRRAGRRVSTSRPNVASSVSTPISKAMDCLKPGDVAIFATPPAFRWVHFGYAIEKGLNVFMEKPLTSDGPTSRRMLKQGEEVGRQEPQGGRGPDVAPQPADPRVASAHRRRRNRRHLPAARLPADRAAGDGVLRSLAGNTQ